MSGHLLKAMLMPKTAVQANNTPLTKSSGPKYLLMTALVGLFVAVGIFVVLKSQASAGEVPFEASGLNGSGFQNVVAWSPFRDVNGKRPVILGADVAGMHRSLDGGKNWLPIRDGVGDTHIASVVFSDTVAGKVYAATNGGIAVSTDFGLHWTQRAGAVNFDGNGNFQLGGVEHPRPTGRLLALDTTGSIHFLYAATATQGVKRSNDDGASWQQIALAGHHLRSIALDPSNPDKLFVGDVTGGLQVSTNATSGMTFNAVAGGPAISEEIKFINGKLYVAGGADGIFMYDGAWHALNTGIPGSSKWESITGYRSGTSTVLYAGCTEPVNGQHTMKSVDGGATWNSISSGSGVTVNRQEYGQTVQWWAASSSYLSFSGGSFVTADIAIDPDNANNILIAGRGGAKAGVQSSSGVQWWPSVHGLMVTVNNMVVPDMKLPGRVYDASMDYTFISSNDHARSFISGTGPAAAPSTGDYISLDPDGPAGRASKVYVAASQRGQATHVGSIYSNADPVGTPDAWTDENAPGNNDVIALGVGHNASGSRIILASVTGAGLYRKDGASWSQITGTTPFASGGYGTIVWKPNTQIVYAIDAGGIWRSNAAGAQGSWTRLASGGTGYDNINALAIDPTAANTIFASDSAGISRVTATDTASPNKTLILPLANPGPIAIGTNGDLYAHDRSGARLMKSTNPTAANPTFVNVANAFYADNNSRIRSLAIDADNYLYTASNGAGLTVGRVGGSTPSPSPTQTSTPTPTPPPTPTPATGVGDLNGDHRVNVFDLSLMLSRWGSADKLADINHSGTVDVFDLSMLLAHWTG